MSIFTKRKPDTSEQDLEDQARLASDITTVRAVLARYHRGTKLHFGAPTKCPNCGDYGFVRAVNRTRGVSQLDCFSCHAEWVISVAALQAIEDEPRPTPVKIVPLWPMPLPTAEIPVPAPEPMPAPAAPAAPAIVHLDPVTIVIDQVEPAGPPPGPYADHPSIRPVPSPVGPGTVTPLPRNRVARDDRTELRVLTIDDNPFDVAIIEELIGGLPQGSVELRHATTLSEALQLALFEPVDLVLLDLGLPDSTGVATLLEWQLASTTSAPVIVVTGDNHPETVRETQLLGAAQFVHKQHIAALVNQADGSAKLLRLLQTTARAPASRPQHTQDA